MVAGIETTAKINILFVSATVPYPATDGGRIRVMNLVSRLCQIHNVTLLTFITSPVDERGVEYLRDMGVNIVGVRYVQPKFMLALRSLLQFLIRGKPLTVGKYYSVKMAKILKTLLRSHRFDIIHFEMLHTGQFLPDLKMKRRPGFKLFKDMGDSSHIQDSKQEDGTSEIESSYRSRPYATVLGEQNIDSSVWHRIARTEPNPLKKLIFYSQYRSFVNYESLICRHFDMCICVSAQDQRRLASLCPGTAIGVVPNGVDLGYFKPGEFEEGDTRLVFTGSMDWQPNEDAVLYFCDRILPLIQAEIPETRFYIVGSNPTERVLGLSEVEGVTVTGSVEDVRPYIASAAVYVVPLRSGGGTRLKILQALAMEKAVVSTTVGCEGLELQLGRHLLVADRPQQFAAKTIQLMKNRLLRRRLGKNGRELVRERFDWDVIVKDLDLRYRRLFSGISPAVDHA